jgi:hypothetical protein
MRTYIIILIAAVIGIFIYASNGNCAFCFDSECYSSSSCGSGCICIKRGMDMTGYCASIN